MNPETPKFTPVAGSSLQQAPVRLLIVQGEERPAVDAAAEPMVMTFPHLLVREVIAFLSISLVLVIAALLLNAPLEEIANPDKTPNPAKAPWYFLGLQELLHYYPPVVAGVLIPTLLVLALAVVPYFRVNVERTPMWESRRALKLFLLAVVVGGLTAVFYFTGAHPVWPLIGPLWFVGGAMGVGAFLQGHTRFARWLHTRSIPFCIFTWFLLAALTLTVIGIFFRGPGWSFTLPWRDGVFY
jgi:hypothetical protein